MHPDPRPIDATLSVTRAAHVLGVHPNTVRAWSQQGRLRYYRINARGDRRYRLGDLHAFLAEAERGSAAMPTAGAQQPADAATAQPGQSHSVTRLAPAAGELAAGEPAGSQPLPPQALIAQRKLLQKLEQVTAQTG